MLDTCKREDRFNFNYTLNGFRAYKKGLINTNYRFDHYEESWDRLGFVAIQGVAQILTENFDRSAVLRLLGAKYPQYRNMDLRYAPVIQINVEKCSSWGVFK